MRIALDATYSVDPQPSGIAVYSRRLLNGLAASYPRDQFLFCYRAKQFRSANLPPMANVRRRILLPPLPTFRSQIFHALNQRMDWRPSSKVVSTFHDLFVMTGDYSSPDFRARFTGQARRAAERSDLVIAVSEFTAAQVSGLLGFDRARIRVIPHGVVTPDSPCLERQKIVLFVGVLQARKNVKRLVEAFETLPSAWTLILAGALTGYKSREILSRIEQSPARERIRVTGYLSKTELETLFQRASIFAFPSLDEGFGIPVLEAMASGVPVVTSNNSALAEIARDAAILVDPNRTDEIAAALHRLASEPELWHALVSAGKIRVGTYTWERAINATYAVYRELTR